MSDYAEPKEQTKVSTPARGPEAYLDPDERKFWQRGLGFPEDFPPRFKSWLVDFIAVNIPQIPISQIVGFSQFTANQVQVVTSETTTSLTYTNLATDGPTISGLSKGTYLLLFGGIIENSVGSHAFISVSVNGATPVEADAASAEPISTTADFNLSRAVTKSLDAASNTVKLQYRVGAGTGTFYNRWLVVLRIGN